MQVMGTVKMCIRDRYKALDAQYAKEQDALEIEIAELEKAVTGYEQSQKSAEKFIALDVYKRQDRHCDLRLLMGRKTGALAGR